MQLPRTSKRQVGVVDDDGEGEELAGLVVEGVDVGVSEEGDEDGDELPGSVVEGVGDVVEGHEEEGEELVDGGGVVDGVSDDEGVVVAGELVDGGSVYVGSVEGLVVGGDVVSDVVVGAELEPGEKIKKNNIEEMIVHLPEVGVVPPSKRSPTISGRLSWR